MENITENLVLLIHKFTLLRRQLIQLLVLQGYFFVKTNLTGNDSVGKV